MPKSIGRGLVGAGAILLAILLTGCSDTPSPTPSAEAVPSPTVTAQPGVTPEPTPTMAPTNTPTPEPTPAAATLSLYEYLTQCAPPEQELADAATYGDVSVLAAELIQRLEAMVPPADLVEWHHLYIELFRTGQAMYDRFPKDDVIDNAKMDEFLLAVAPYLEEKYSGLEEKLSEVAVRLPEHLRQQMIEVDCLDPDIVPDDYDEPDDHGNNFESATRIAIGEAVAIELEFRLDKDVLVFLAEPGTEYEFTLDWGRDSRLRRTARPILALFDAGGQEFARLNHYVFGSQDKMMWQAVTRGDYYIVVGDTVTDGSITLTVTDGEATEQLDRDDATGAPTSTPTPEPTPAAATLSLDEYLTHCVTTELELADDATFGDLSSDLAAEEDRFEALTPPVQLSEWHLLNIEGFRTIQAFVELQPKDDVIDFIRFFLMASISADSEEKLSEAASRLPEDVLQQMIEAGCIDPEDLPSVIADGSDDHGDDIDDATAIRVGVGARGAVDYEGDVDYFRFQAERGQSYQIDVALGSLDDSIVEMYDSDGLFLDSNDDYSGNTASRLLWQASSSGELYVAVAAFGSGVGTYTLTVTLSTIVDDHGDDIDDATAIRVGTDVPGVLDYVDDIDYFRFQAEQGQSYQIDVALGSLDDSIVGMYDSDGLFLDSNDDYSGNTASRLLWQAPSAGERYVSVYGYGTGTYTLTVSHSTIVDDHGDDIDDATAIRVGVGARGAVDYDGDIDFFRFQAERGQSYRIDVALGSLDDSIVELHDYDGLFLDSNDDYSGNTASRLSWQASSSGELYVAVAAFGSGIGTYTLTVSLIGDHGNDFESATRIGIGKAVAIELENPDDMEVLVFRARPGTEYVFTLDWGTYQIWDNPGSIMALYDASGQLLARLNDYDFSAQRIRNKITWQAVTGGDYYIVVGDEKTLGTFALTVTGGEATEQLDGDDQSDTPGNATNAGNTSYDTDGDGLIEVSDLMQLNAVRWDLDGDGSPSSNATGYNAAFPNAIAGMGCPDSGCSGYELISDMDFDTNGNGRADAGDDYWNDGEGWLPIGDDFEAPFETFFNGGGHTISNLYIDRRDAKYAGLFGNAQWDGSNYFVGLNNNIRDLALVNVDVQGGTYTGGLAGSNGLVIVTCSVTGGVSGGGSGGGLVGNNFSGLVIASYSAASVADGSNTGGLVGSNFVGRIIASYSIGSVSDYDGVGGFVEVGGLVGSNFADRGTARDSYWNTQTSGQSESAGGQGKTTRELQSPTGYTGIYENWNMDLDEDGVDDDLWDFGTPNQYPTLRS